MGKLSRVKTSVGSFLMLVNRRSHSVLGSFFSSVRKEIKEDKSRIWSANTTRNVNSNVFYIFPPCWGHFWLCSSTCVHRKSVTHIFFCSGSTWIPGRQSVSPYLHESCRKPPLALVGGQVSTAQAKTKQRSDTDSCHLLSVLREARLIVKCHLVTFWGS